MLQNNKNCRKNAASCGTAKTPQNLIKCPFCGVIAESKSKFWKNHEIRFLFSLSLGRTCCCCSSSSVERIILSSRPPLNIFLGKKSTRYFFLTLGRTYFLSPRTCDEQQKKQVNVLLFSPEYVLTGGRVNCLWWCCTIHVNRCWGEIAANKTAEV